MTDLAVFLWTAILTILVWVLLIVAVAAVWQVAV